jgi:anti-sigma B factor antagonist
MQSLNEFHPAYFRLEAVDDVAIARFHVVRLAEDQNIEQLGQDLFALLEQYNCLKVILSLKSVEYLTSAVLGKFITLHRKMHRSQGRLFICDLRPEVREVMRTSRLLDYYNVTDTVDQALIEIQIT